MKIENDMHFKKLQDLNNRLDALNAKDPKSMGDLAKAIGISRSALSDFKRGKRDTYIHTLAKIERYVLEHERIER